MRIVIFGAQQQRLGRIDPACGGIVAGDAHRPEIQYVAFGRRRASSCRTNSHRAGNARCRRDSTRRTESAVASPAGKTISGWATTGVIVFTPEAHAQLTGEIHGLATGRRGRDPVFSIEENRVTRVGGPGEMAGMLGRNELSFARRDIHEIGVFVGSFVPPAGAGRRDRRYRWRTSRRHFGITSFMDGSASCRNRLSATSYTARYERDRSTSARTFCIG